MVNEPPATEDKPTSGITPPTSDTIKKITVDGYSFEVDTDRIDDVEILDTIDAIENQKRMREIVTFLEYLLTKQGYEDLKAYFVKKDGKFKLSKLFEVYQAIFEQFDPKG